MAKVTTHWVWPKFAALSSCVICGWQTKGKLICKGKSTPLCEECADEIGAEKR